VIDQFLAGLGQTGEQGARLDRAPQCELSRHEFEGATVVVVQVAENLISEKPCYIKAKGVGNGSYKRVDDKDLHLSPMEIFELGRALAPSDDDREPVDDTSIDDLDPGLVDEILNAHRHSRALRDAATREARLERLNISDRQGRARFAGLIACGRYPQQYFPRLLVDVSAYPALEKSPPGVAVRYVDREQCEGPIPEVFETAIAVISRNLRTHGIIDGVSRRDELEIPLSVLREALANAILHREYNALFRALPVTVEIYPDRVEIANPGGLWGGVTPESLGEGVSQCRNPILLRLLQSLEFKDGGGPTVEGLGSGIRHMNSAMQEHSLRKPDYRIGFDRVTVVLYRHGTESEEHRQWVQGITDREPTRQEDIALSMVRQDGEVSVVSLRERAGMDSDDARALLAGLKRAGVLSEREGEIFVLSTGTPLPTERDEVVLAVLGARGTASIQEIAEATGRSVPSLRPTLRRLIDTGWVEATAPPTSRHRRYRRV